MTIYRRYKKLKKVVNGVPQNEFKKGDLVDEKEWRSKSDCENSSITQTTEEQTNGEQ